MHPSRFVEIVVLFLLMCFWFPFPCYGASWPSTFPVCKSTTNLHSRGFIYNILVASLSWGFAWITESQQGWPTTCSRVWVLFLWSCLLVMHLKRNWAAKQHQLREFGMWLAGGIRQLGLVISNYCFLTVFINRNHCSVVIWSRRRSFRPALPWAGSWARAWVFLCLYSTCSLPLFYPYVAHFSFSSGLDIVFEVLTGHWDICVNHILACVCQMLVRMYVLFLTMSIPYNHQFTTEHVSRGKVGMKRRAVWDVLSRSVHTQPFSISWKHSQNWEVSQLTFKIQM